MKFGYRGILLLFVLFLLVCSVRLGQLMVPASQPAMLSKQQVGRELYQILGWLERESAFYAHLSASQQQLLAQKLRQIIPGQGFISLQEYGDKLARWLAATGDPASQVLHQHKDIISFDLNIIPEEGRWLAMRRNHRPLQRDFPFVTHIDGVPIHVLVSHAGRYLPGNTDPDATAPLLTRLQMLRQTLGLDIRQPPRLTLTNEAGTDILTLWLNPEARQAATTQSKHSGRNDLSYLSHNAALLVIRDLDTLDTRQLKQAMQRQALVLDISRARGKHPLLLNTLTATLAHNRELPRLTAKYKVWGPENKRRLESLGLRPLKPSEALESQTAPGQQDVINNSMSPKFVRQFDSKRSALSKAPSSLVLITGPECRQACAQLAYIARFLPGVTLAGSSFTGDFSPRTYLRLPYSGLALSASTSLFYTESEQLLSGQIQTPDIAISGHKPLDWYALTALLSASTQWQLTASEQ